MKKLLSIALLLLFCIGFTACGSTASTSNSNQTASTTSNSNQTKNKIYGQGEEAFMIDSNGKQMYSLKINSVKAVNLSDVTTNNLSVDSMNKEFAEANKNKQIVEVDYTYKNIAKDDEGQLYIDGTTLLVADATGTLGKDPSCYPHGLPQKTPVGMSCNVQGYYGLATVSDKVRISFTSPTYNKTLTYEIPVQ